MLLCRMSPIGWICPKIQYNNKYFFIFYDMIKNNYNHPMYLAPEQSSDDTGMCIVLFTGLIVALSVGIMIGLWIATNVQ